MQLDISPNHDTGMHPKNQGNVPANVETIYSHIEMCQQMLNQYIHTSIIYSHIDNTGNKEQSGYMSYIIANKGFQTKSKQFSCHQLKIAEPIIDKNQYLNRWLEK